MARRRKAPTPWRWSELTYDMRVLTWWFRNAPEPRAEVRPWRLVIAATVAAWLLSVALCTVLFIV